MCVGGSQASSHTPRPPEDRTGRARRAHILRASPGQAAVSQRLPSVEAGAAKRPLPTGPGGAEAISPGVSLPSHLSPLPSENSSSKPSKPFAKQSVPTRDRAPSRTPPGDLQGRDGPALLSAKGPRGTGSGPSHVRAIVLEFHHCLGRESCPFLASLGTSHFYYK